VSARNVDLGGWGILNTAGGKVCKTIARAVHAKDELDNFDSTCPKDFDGEAHNDRFFSPPLCLKVR